MVVFITLSIILIMVFLKVFIILVGEALKLIHLLLEHASITIPMSIFIYGSFKLGIISMVLLTLSTVFVFVIISMIVYSRFENASKLPGESNKIGGTGMHII